MTNSRPNVQALSLNVDKEQFLIFRYISDLFSHMETELRGWDSKGILHIGAGITIGSLFLPCYVKAFSDICPDIDVRVTIEQSERLEKRFWQTESYLK